MITKNGIDILLLGVLNVKFTCFAWMNTLSAINGIAMINATVINAKVIHNTINQRSFANPSLKNNRSENLLVNLSDDLKYSAIILLIPLILHISNILLILMNKLLRKAGNQFLVSLTISDLLLVLIMSQFQGSLEKDSRPRKYG